MPRAKRIRKTKRDDHLKWVCILGCLVLLAAVPIFALSQLQRSALRVVHAVESIPRSAIQNLKLGRNIPHPVNGSALALGPVQFFPLVQELKVIDSRYTAALAADIRVEVLGGSTASPLLVRAAARVERMLRSLRDEPFHAALAATSSAWLVRAVHVTAASQDERLQDGPAEEYWVDCHQDGEKSDGFCLVKAIGIYGAINALQSTLLQLFSDRGAASFRSLTVHDWPRFKVRGLMVDAGRRFVPMQILKQQVVEGMAITRMNLLHLHLNDFCRFALDLPGFPELRQEGSMAGQYSISDIRELVEFARDRGVRVVPEIDIPGHANALIPLKSRGLAFCESSHGTRNTPNEATKIFDDPEGKSRAVLRQLFTETAAAFSADEPWFHLGADEASPVGSCTAENIATLEGYISSVVIGQELQRSPVAWEELLFKQSDTLTRKAVRDPNTIIIAWFREKPEDVTDQGYRLLVANSNRHYLDYDFKRHPIANFWYDPGVLQREMPRFRDCSQPSWEEHRGTFLGTYADNRGVRPLDVAQRDCTDSGSVCVGVTCMKASGNSKCDTRKGEPFLQASASEVSWVKLCPEEVSNLASNEHARANHNKAKAMQQKLLGGVSAMWTDRYCYVYSCGAADENWARRNGLLPGASRMFSRDVDASFALSFAGMVWPRAGVTAATLWNYQASLSEKVLLNRTAWLASLLRKFGIMSCPANCDCDELSACGEVLPIIKDGAPVNDAALLASCFPQAPLNENTELGGRLDSLKQSFSSSLRMCFWQGKECGGVSCSISPTSGTRECELRAAGTGHVGSELYVKRSGC